jgi:hypothetical protein
MGFELLSKRRGWVLVLALCSACEPSPQGDPVAATSMGEPLPRYWLKGTTLLATPGGKSTHEVRGPVLVELMPYGRVRTLTGAKDPFEVAASTDSDGTRYRGLGTPIELWPETSCFFVPRLVAGELLNDRGGGLKQPQSLRRE